MDSTIPHHPDCQIIPIAPAGISPADLADATDEVTERKGESLVVTAMVKCHPDCPRRKVKA